MATDLYVPVFLSISATLNFAYVSIGWGRAVALNPGGEQHRRYRRLLSKVLSSTAVRKFRSLEQRAAEVFLQDLYRTPQEFPTHIRDSVGNMIVDLSYGREPKVGNSGYIDYAEYVHEIFGYAARSFAFLVDIIPLRELSHFLLSINVHMPLVSVKHVPEWLPGAGFQRQARKWRGELDIMAQVPFDMVKSDMVCASTGCLMSLCFNIHNRSKKKASPTPTSPLV